MEPLSLIIILLGIVLIAILVIFIKISKNKPQSANTSELEIKEQELKFLKETLVEKDKLSQGLKNEIITIENELSNNKISLAKEQTENKNKGENLNTERQRTSDLSITLEKEKELSAKLNGELKAQKVAMEGQEEKIIDIQKQFTEKFENLANKIFDDKSSKFSELNKDKLDTLLNPLEKNINEFKQLVRNSYSEEDNKRNLLAAEVKKLMELNVQIGKDAKDLTEALKGSTKQQGDWGEMVLESILQQSGLVEGQQYFKQATLRDETGEVIKNDEGKIMRPDIIVEYPDNRKIIIDSKVSLTSYVEFTSAVEKEDQERAIKRLLISVKKHVDELSAKKYPEYGSELDFVMMFIPIEGAYIAALQSDHNLWSDAYKKNVLLIGPTNIIAALRMIADMWERDKQSKNAEEIASRGGLLYEKFVGFTKSLSDIGSHLDKSKNSYNKAISQLSEGRGNLINQADSLKKLGVKYNKAKHIPSEFTSNIEDNKELGEAEE